MPEATPNATLGRNPEPVLKYWIARVARPDCNSGRSARDSLVLAEV